MYILVIKIRNMLNNIRNKKLNLAVSAKNLIIKDEEITC